MNTQIQNLCDTFVDDQIGKEEATSCVSFGVNQIVVRAKAPSSKEEMNEMALEHVSLLRKTFNIKYFIYSVHDKGYTLMTEVEI